MIISTILYQVGFVAPDHATMETWEDYELIGALQNFLSDKRYNILESSLLAFLINLWSLFNFLV